MSTTEDKVPLLQGDPSSQPGPANDWTRSGQTGIPQPDGSVLFIGQPTNDQQHPPTGHAQPGPPGNTATGASAAASQDEPRKKQLPLDPAPGAMPQRYDPRNNPPGFYPAPGDARYGQFPPGKMPPPPTRLDPAPGDMQQSLDPAPGDIRYPPAATGAATPGFRPPSDPQHVRMDGVKLPQTDANRAPDNSQQPLGHPTTATQQPNSIHSAYPPHQYPQPQPYQQQHPQHYPQPQYPQYPQPQYPQPHPPLHPAQHGPGYPGGYGTVPRQVPPQPIKTSRKFEMKTLDDNQYYLSICLLITLCVCLNPFPLICVIPGFIHARKAADAMEGNSIEVARKHHKNAQFCNIGGAVSMIVGGTFIVTLVVVLALEVPLALSTA